MVNELGPGVGAREHLLERQNAHGVHDAHGKLNKLCLGDELLERVLVSEGGKEIVAVHDAVDDAVDEAPERLRLKTQMSEM